MSKAILLLLALLGVSTVSAQNVRRDTSELVKQLLDMDAEREAELESVKRQLEDLKAKQEQRRRLNGKSSSRDEYLCYGNETALSGLTVSSDTVAGNTTEMTAEMSLNIGVVEIEKDEGVMVEVSLTSLFLDLVEVETAVDGTLAALRAAVIEFTPILIGGCTFPTKSSDDSLPDCSMGTVVMPEPAGTLQLSGFSNNELKNLGVDGPAPGEGFDFVGFETTHSAKFYFPSSALDLDDKDKKEEFVVVGTFFVGVRSTPFAENLRPGILGTAFNQVNLGPYMVQVKVIEAMDEECDYEYIALSGEMAPVSGEFGEGIAGGLADLETAEEADPDRFISWNGQ